jgi:APA family basic amino acid/polyamine antiporter
MARANLLPARFANLSDRSVPAVAVVVIGMWSLVLAASGTFDVLTDIYVFVLWIFFAMNGAAVIILRRRYPDFPRPYKVTGYPLVPVIFILVAGYLLINTLLVTPGRALAGLALIVVGLPVYRYFERRMNYLGPKTWLGQEDSTN